MHNEIIHLFRNLPHFSRRCCGRTKTAGTMAKLMGIDVGSTTVKVTVVEQDGTVLYKSYERHFAQVRETVLKELNKIKNQFGGDFCASIIEAVRVSAFPSAAALTLFRKFRRRLLLSAVFIPTPTLRLNLAAKMLK